MDRSDCSDHDQEIAALKAQLEAERAQFRDALQAILEAIEDTRTSPSNICHLIRAAIRVRLESMQEP